MKTTIAYQIEKAGNIKNLKKTTIEIPAPEANQVQVDVKAIGLNYADIFAIKGLYGATPKGSFVPGLEYAGDIVAIGTEVDDFKVGDRVMGVTRFGGYTSHINIETDYVSIIPDSWSYQEGASFLVQALTAYYGLFHLANIKAGETVLIHSAAGGVGIQANRMAQKVGAYTIGTIGNSIKADTLKGEGYQDYIVRDKDFEKQLHAKLQGRELNIVMECIGGKVMKTGYKLMASQGRLVNYGSAHYGDNASSPNWLRLAWLYLTRPKIDAQDMIESNKSILGFNLIWLYEKKMLMKEILHALKELNLPAPIVGNEFEFDKLPEAIRLFQSGKTIGKVVVTTD